VVEARATLISSRREGLSYTRAAEELRSAYEVARLGSSNLPPYAELVEPDAS
jgi:hypothetical protein